MTPQQVVGLGPALAQLLGSFKACFGERRLLNHFATYCRGLLSNLQRKSVEPIALAAGCTVRALQLFLTHRVWDHHRLRDQLQQRIAACHAPAPGVGRRGDDLGLIGLIDETGTPKKGPMTPGVQRQYCGASGKIDNCIVTVHLGCSHGGFLALLDSELFLPQGWAQDRHRCREADIPDDLDYRPKTAIALELIRRAIGNGLRFDWQVFDEGYGKDPSFLFGLDALGQTWIGEIPKSFRCWPVLPQYHSQRKEFASKKACNVVRWSQKFIYQQWQTLTFPRQTTTPAVWDVKAAQVHLSRNGWPTDRTYWLIVAWNRQTGEYKYFLSNAPPTTDLHLLLRVAFRRADVEHLFRVGKSEVGLSHFEGRSYVGLMRHLILCQLVILFLAEQAQRINAEQVEAERHEQPPAASSDPPPSQRGEKGSGPIAVGHVAHPAAPHDAGADRSCPQLDLFRLA